MSVCAAAAILLVAAFGPPRSLRADLVPPHGVVAANLDVVVNDFANTAGSTTVATPQLIGDFRIRSANNGDYNIQIGDDYTDDVDGGVVITCVSQNGGREDGHPLFLGPGCGTSHWAVSDAGNTAGSWIPVFLPYSDDDTTYEWDMDVAAAWFPYSNFLGGYAHYSSPASMNNTTLDAFTGSPGLALGTHFVDAGGALYRVDLTSLGIDSRTDGVLLVVGAKNDDNYASVWVNTSQAGTWTIRNRDSRQDGAGGEQDPVGFVFVPKNSPGIISGRFLGNGTINMFSGAAPRFTVTPLDVGQWELKVPGLRPAHGILIISPEGGLPGNQDNYVTYEVNTAGDGWIIESRDLPAPVGGPYVLPLETPGDGTEPVASFAFILGATPGFTVIPTANLQTSETWDTAAFTVVLDTAPTADVTINLSSSDTTEGTIFPASLTFTPGDWDIPQTVTVSGVDDPLEDGPIAFTIVLAAATSADATYHGLDPSDVLVINTDNEAGITVTPAAGLTTSEAGDTAAFTIQLNTQPTADVVIGLSSSDTTEGTVSPASVTFTRDNYFLPVTVTVTGVNDAVDDGDIAYTITTAPATSSDAAYNGKDALDVGATNTDDDTVGIVVDPTSLSILEGATGSFTVVLASEPTADVVVNVVSSNPVNGPAAPATLTFTALNWSTAQTVTVTATDNLAAGGDIACTITNTAASSDPLYAAINPADVGATLQDNDATVALPSGGAVYGSGMPAVGIDGRATVVDPNTAQYDTGSLTVTVTANGTADDRLEVRNTGTDLGQIGVSGNSVTYEGTPIGTMSGGAGTTPLVITLNSAATPAAAEALLRSVTFRNVNTNPPPTVRTVTVALQDADGGAGTASTTVRVGLLRVSDFQEGADHGYGVYTGAADIELYQGGPDTPWPNGHANTGLWLDVQDAGSYNACHVLLRFDNILGTGPGQIPTNAAIVSAELILNVPPDVSNAQGDASPLYRMMVEWDAETATWNSFGNYDGIVPDDFRARGAYDSFWGLSNGDSNTGTGNFGIGVTLDLQAWVSGSEMNYGWLLPTWNTTGTADGTLFSSSEAAIIDRRPRLRVMWLPEGTASASFRQDVNDYTGAQDTRLRMNEPDTDRSAIATLFSDWIVSGNTNNNEQILLQFADIIGANPGQIPPHAQIHAAILDLSCSIGNAMGDGGMFHAMLKPWVHTDTWNTMVDGITADGVEAAMTPTAIAGNATLAPNVQAGIQSFEMTPDVQAWVNGTLANNGWVLLPWPNGGDGWGFGSAEQANEWNRPQLRVFYSPGEALPDKALLQKPVHKGSSVELTFSGTAGRTYSVQRAEALGGAWATIGSTTVSTGGTAAFTDASPLPNTAFYRVVYP